MAGWKEGRRLHFVLFKYNTRREHDNLGVCSGINDNTTQHNTTQHNDAVTSRAILCRS